MLESAWHEHLHPLLPALWLHGFISRNASRLRKGNMRMSSSYMSPHVGATSVASTHTEHSPSLLFHALLMSLGGTCLSNFWLGRTTSQSYLDYSATPRSPGHAPRPSSLAAEASVSVPASAKKRRKSSRCFESLRIHRVCATHPWAPEA